MIIKISDYGNGVHNLILSKSTEKLGLEERFFGDALLKIKMDRSQYQIVLDCNLLINARLNCDRCTEEFNTELTRNFQSIYLFGDRSESSEGEDYYYLNPDDDKIVLNDIVFEYSELAIPLKILCNEDCKGLCLKCGTNLNYSICNCGNNKIDPVWSPLKNLKNNKK